MELVELAGLAGLAELAELAELTELAGLAGSPEQANRGVPRNGERWHLGDALSAPAA
jgi:hypothetical protein